MKAILRRILEVSDKLIGGFPEFDPWRRRYSGGAAWLLFLVALAALFLMLKPDFVNQHKQFARLILAAAAILPPVHLWFEYNIIWRTASVNSRPSLEEYKYAQETAKNMWLAFVAVLIALYFK